jgi:AsmA protein
MQQTDPTLASPAAGLSNATPPPTPKPLRSHLRRFGLYYFALFLLLLLIIVPPLLNVSRFQRRIATSISQSLGRTVTLDNVTLNLLPFPGFTLQNLVVAEDPAFGSEPIIRAMSVRANLRISSLWRRQVEFSTISFTDTTSVNLVHLPDGRWNLDSILTQASHINAAPTAQKVAGPTPRFPYIEATGARVNLKLGYEKLPVSLTEADFALWLPDPAAWHLRIEGHPARTDTDVSDTGTIRLEAILGRASSIDRVPISVDGEWSTAPLGEVTHLLLGRDAGIRGNMDLTAHLQGSVGNANIDTHLRLISLRRADFIPARALTVDIQCHGIATNTFHTFTDSSCHWPTDSPAVFFDAAFPDVRDLNTATGRISLSGLPAVSLLDWLHVLSSRTPNDLIAIGTVTGSIQSQPGLIYRWHDWPTLADTTLQATNLSLQSATANLPATQFGDITLENTPQTPAPSATPHTKSPKSAPAPAGLYLAPTNLDLGAPDPATLQARIDATGYTLHLTGPVILSRLISLGKAIPAFGDNLDEALPTANPAKAPEAPNHVDLTATRAWGGIQHWQDTTPHPAIPTHRKPR